MLREMWTNCVVDVVCRVADVKAGEDEGGGDCRLERPWAGTMLVKGLKAIRTPPLQIGAVFSN